MSWHVDPNDTSSHQPHRDRDLIDAALAGAGSGLELVTRCGVDTAPYRVDVVHVQFDLMDIEASAVRAAAILAVADAFEMSDHLRLDFADGWTVELVSHGAGGEAAPARPAAQGGRGGGTP